MALGLSHATGELLTYVPADGQFDPKEISSLIEAIGGVDLVIGYKNSFSSYTWFRKIHSFVYRMLLRGFFQFGVEM